MYVILHYYNNNSNKKKKKKKLHRLIYVCVVNLILNFNNIENGLLPNLYLKNARTMTENTSLFFFSFNISKLYLEISFINII